MALGKIIQMLLRSAGGKKAAAKLYKQARKGIPHKSSDVAGVQIGKSYRSQWSKTDVPYTGKRLTPSEIYKLEDKYGPAPVTSYQEFKNLGKMGKKRSEWFRQKARQERRAMSEGIGPISSSQYYKKSGDYIVPKYYERFPREMTEELFRDKGLYGRYPKGKPGMTRMKDFIRKGYRGKPWDQMARKLPHKSPGAPGVRVGADPVRDLRTLNPLRREMEAAKMSPAALRILKKRASSDLDAWNVPERAAGLRRLGMMTRGEFAKPSFRMDRPPSPLRAKTQESIMRMRRDPGMARGLERMEARKASAFNTPGAPWEGKPLRYEPNPTNLRARQLMAGAKSSREMGFMEFVASMEAKGLKVTKKNMGMLRELFFKNFSK